MMTANAVICKKSSGKLKLHEPKTDEAREIVRYVRRHPELAVRQAYDDGTPSRYWRIDPEAAKSHMAGAAEREAAYKAECEARHQEWLRQEEERIAAERAEREAAEREAQLAKVRARADRITKAEARLERAKAAEAKARATKHRGVWPDPDDVPEGYGIIHVTAGEYTTHYSMSGPGIAQVRCARYGGYGGPVSAAWSYDNLEITTEDLWDIPEGAHLALPNDNKYEPADLLVDMKLLVRTVKAGRSVSRAEAALKKSRGGGMMKCVHCGRVVPRSGICMECGDDQY